MRISDWCSDVCSSELMPSDWFMVFSSYGQAFRAPHMDELYLTGTHFEIPVGAGVVNRFVSNPDLDPQRTETLELGLGFDFTEDLEERDRLRIKASHFSPAGSSEERRGG